MPLSLSTFLPRQYKGCIITLIGWGTSLVFMGMLLIVISLFFYRTISAGILRTALPMWMQIIENDVSVIDRTHFSNSYLRMCYSIEHTSYAALLSHTNFFKDVQDNVLTQKEINDFVSNASTYEH